MIDRRVLVQGGSAWGVCHQVGCVLALYGLLVLYGLLALYGLLVLYRVDSFCNLQDDLPHDKRKDVAEISTGQGRNRG